MVLLFGKEELKNYKNNRGQVTIFVIVGVLIVVSVTVFSIIYLFPRGGDSFGSDADDSMEGCVKEAIEDSIDIILPNGGVIEPEKYIMYRGEKYNYLCYNPDYYMGCYNLYPLIEKDVEELLRDNTKDEVQTCFDSFREEIESKGFEVTGGATSYSIDLLPKKVSVSLKKEIATSKGESSQKFEDFSFEFNSPLYDILEVVNEIVNDEANFCHFEYSGFMSLYPEFDIRRWNYRGSNLYVVGYRNSNMEFKFAVRSCAGPPGI